GGPEPRRCLPAAWATSHRGGGRNDPSRRPRQRRHLGRQSVEAPAAGLPDLHVHLCDRPEADGEGGRAEEVHSLGTHPRAGGRAEAALLATPKGGSEGVPQDAGVGSHLGGGDKAHGVGNLHTMRRPRPGPPEASTSPPAETTTCLTIAKPSPVPRDA